LAVDNEKLAREESKRIDTRVKKTGGAMLLIFDLHPLDRSLGTIAGKLLEVHRMKVSESHLRYFGLQNPILDYRSYKKVPKFGLSQRLFLK